MSLRPRFLALALAAGIVAAAPAGAISISGLSVVPTAGNTASSTVNAGNSHTQVGSQVSVSNLSLSALDVAGAMLGFDSRFATIVAADRESAGGTTTATGTAAYSITFTVDNPTGGLYQLDIDTSRVGLLAIVSDSSGGATATLGAVSATLDGVANATLGLAAAATLTGTGSTSAAVSQSSGTLSLVDTALTRTFTLTFTWTATAASSRDEVAVLLGMTGGLNNSTADNYPGGVADPTHGHLVSVGVTLLAVPEPRLDTLLALCFLATAALRFRAPRS